MRHAALNFDRQNAGAVTIFLNEVCNWLAECAKREAETVSNHGNNHADPRHLEA